MLFGEAVRLIFEAHFEDLASGIKEDKLNTRFTNQKLQTAINFIPWKWKKALLMEFSVITGELRRAILKCPHTNFTVPYNGWENCSQCGSHRSLKKQDDCIHSYNENMVWTEWEVY